MHRRSFFSCGLGIKVVNAWGSWEVCNKSNVNLRIKALVAVSDERCMQVSEFG